MQATVRMKWEAGSIVWDAFERPDTTGTVIAHAEHTADIPVPANEQVNINLWVKDRGLAAYPALNTPTTVVTIRDFFPVPAGSHFRILLRIEHARIDSHFNHFQVPSGFMRLKCCVVCEPLARVHGPQLGPRRAWRFDQAASSQSTEAGKAGLGAGRPRWLRHYGGLDMTKVPYRPINSTVPIADRGSGRGVRPREGWVAGQPLSCAMRCRSRS